MHPHHHAVSSVRKWGGEVSDYLPIHEWFDASKAHLPDLRHRALRHHSEGIFACEEVFGSTLTNSAGRIVPVRQIGEQHVMEDLGRIPTAADWLRAIKMEPWMLRRAMTSDEISSRTKVERAAVLGREGEARSESQTDPPIREVGE
jgi:hypothetical protein